MILRRLASAIRQQKWSQIITEILILVIGIFLGLQVDEWNKNRENQIQETKYLTQLHEEVIERAAAFRGNFASRKLAQEKLIDVLEYFAGKRKLSDLGSTHCYGVFSAHILNSRLIALPTITELISSGQLHVITSDKLRLSFSQYEVSLTQLETFVSGISTSMMVFSRDYPDLIDLDPNMRIIQNYNDFEHQCNFEAIDKDKGAKNSVIDNSARLNTYVSLIGRQENIFENLHNYVDQELGITH